MSDRFTFNFDQYVWRNQRRSIRESKDQHNSIRWYSILFAFLMVLQERLVRINWLYNQIKFSSSSGKGLDWWGNRYDTKRDRENNENDTDYKLRILFEHSYKQKAASISVKRSLISTITGKSLSEIKAEKLIDSLFVMGGPIGSICASRDYFFYSVRYYIPTIDRITRRNVLNMLNKTTIGGNYYEVWEELEDLSSVEPGDGDIYKGQKLSDGILSLQRYWLVY
ncbi:hypothetical protein JWG40_03950 [Leptospira sp. 201903074]|uniref:hypothetical protein n=1 Tax=Leptospira abararensis TaxID=2810036 RepID=UPI00196324CB|nr:hypothetical protein [Leptospira abararensis]MBM9546154.1 hypothetical protein [Leptospira abararensis]